MRWILLVALQLVVGCTRFGFTAPDDGPTPHDGAQDARAPGDAAADDDGRTGAADALVVARDGGPNEGGTAPVDATVVESGTVHDSGPDVWPAFDAGTDVNTSPTQVVVGASSDTALNSFAPSLNYGGGTAFNVKEGSPATYTGLVRFDLASAPLSGTVISAALRLTTTATGSLSTGDVTIHVVREAWTEGTAIGSAGVASWKDRLAGVSWTAAGCGVGARDSAAVGAVQPRASNTTYTTPIPSGAVQSWLTDAASNHGFALVAVGSGNGTAGFRSREAGAGAPELVLELTP